MNIPNQRVWAVRSSITIKYIFFTFFDISRSILSIEDKSLFLDSSYLTDDMGSTIRPDSSNLIIVYVAKVLCPIPIE